VLADFVAEFTPGSTPKSNLMEGWILNMDGASNSKGTGVGIILTTLEGFLIEQSYSLGFRATNNEAEYEAIIVGLKMATTLEVTKLEVHCNSLLIVSQINGEYTTKDDRIAAYLEIVMIWKANSPVVTSSKSLDLKTSMQTPWPH